MSSRIELLSVAGANKNLRADGSIIAFAGWGISSSLEAEVQLKLIKPIKAVKITAELSGITATKWTYGGKLVTETKLKEKPTKHAMPFLLIKDDVKDVKDLLSPDNSKVMKFPFELKLPANGVFPSLETTSGYIRYFLKVTLSWVESMNLMRSTQEVEVPVLFYIPNHGASKLLKSPTVFKHEVPPSQEKCGCAINVPQRAFRAGDTVTADLTIYSTPPNVKLRLLLVSIKSEATYIGDKRESTIKFPRPLAEFNETFAKVQLVHGQEPLVRRLSLLIDASLAQATMDTPLVSIKTRLQIQIVCDNSELPNITLQVPLIIVPPISPEDAQVMPDPSDLYNERVKSSVPSTPIMQPSPAISTGSQFTFPAATTSPQMSESYMLPKGFALDPPPAGIRPSTSRSSLRQDRSASISSMSGPGPAANHISQKFNHLQFVNPTDQDSASATGSPLMEHHYSPAPSPSMGGARRLPRKSIPDLLEAPSANHISAKLGYLQVGNPPPLYGLGVGIGVGSGSSLNRRPSNPDIYNNSNYQESINAYGSPISPSGFGGYPMSPSRSARSALSAASNSSPKLGHIPEDFVALDVLKQMLPQDPSEWSVDSVAMVVRATGAPDDIVDRFLEEGVDGSIFMSLTMDDLKTHIGISMFSHRHRIMKVITEYESLLAGKED
ncbi:UNVERIFIED_CONTAM: hypothetical protein HDU68_006137 [Siphonaria sp. JEL0065]|nr:hypothetical protein HDU68_006137 [Siphonaria sp. JEL0065]